MIANIDEIKEAIKYFKNVALSSHSYHSERVCAEIALKALYKQNAIKPISHEKHYFKCPYCKEELGIDVDDIIVYDMTPPKHCENCGQALDWGGY